MTGLSPAAKHRWPAEMCLNVCSPYYTRTLLNIKYKRSSNTLITCSFDGHDLVAPHPSTDST